MQIYRLSQDGRLGLRLFRACELGALRKVRGVRAVLIGEIIRCREVVCLAAGVKMKF